jgi:hypothetical protein
MEADLELITWRRQWQADSGVPSSLKQRVERETRGMRRFVVGEIIVTIILGGGSLAWAALSLRTEVFILALGVWVFIAIAWTISFLLRRGAWTPLTATTMAFLELSILRCRRRRESIVAQALLYFMILGFNLTWIYFARGPAAGRPVIAFLMGSEFAWVWAITLALGVVAIKLRQRLARELGTLMDLRRQIEDGAMEPRHHPPMARPGAQHKDS